MDALLVIGFLAWIIANIVGVIQLVRVRIKKEPKKKALIAFAIGLIGFIIMLIGVMNTDTATTETDTQKEKATQVTTDVPETSLEEKQITPEEKGKRDETLKGHGWSDSGREEPQYVGIIGYAVDNRNSISHDKDDTFSDTPWTVPIYEKDKQFYNEVGTIDHKTEVLVLKQELRHEGYGRYSGYLTVEDLQTGEQYLLDVYNFITAPYWTYADPVAAVAVGSFVAEFNQVSDYYPVNSSNEKVELEDGTIVFAVGNTGTYGKHGPDSNTNQIEAIVFKEWKYGYGGVSVFFNETDIKIVY